MSIHPEEWHKERLKGVGSSEAIKLFTGKVEELYKDKTGGTRQEESLTGPCAAGNDLEPIGREKFSQITGYEIQYDPTTKWHENGVMFTHLDGLYYEKDTLIEWEHKAIINPQTAKTLQELINKTTYEKAKSVPPIFKDWYIQAQHSMACTKAVGRMIAVLNVPFVYDFVDFYGRPFLYVERNNSIIKAIETRCIDFWKCVQKKSLDGWQW